MFNKITAKISEIKGGFKLLKSQLPKVQREEILMYQNAENLVLVDEFAACFTLSDDDLQNAESISEIKWFFDQNFDELSSKIQINMGVENDLEMWFIPIRYLTDETKAAIPEIIREIQEDIGSQDVLLAAPLKVLFEIAFEGDCFQEIKKNSLGFDDGNELIEVLKGVNTLSDYHRYLVEAGGPKGAGQNTNGVFTSQDLGKRALFDLYRSL